MVARRPRVEEPGGDGLRGCELTVRTFFFALLSPRGSCQHFRIGSVTLNKSPLRGIVQRGEGRAPQARPYLMAYRAAQRGEGR